MRSSAAAAPLRVAGCGTQGDAGPGGLLPAKFIGEIVYGPVRRKPTQQAGGRWPVADGKWQMANGREQTAEGKWSMADRKCQIANGRWGDGEWSALITGTWRLGRTVPPVELETRRLNLEACILQPGFRGSGFGCGLAASFHQCPIVRLDLRRKC